MVIGDRNFSDAYDIDLYYRDITSRTFYLALDRTLIFKCGSPHSILTPSEKRKHKSQVLQYEILLSIYSTEEINP